MESVKLAMVEADDDLSSLNRTRVEASKGCHRARGASRLSRENQSLCRPFHRAELLRNRLIADVNVVFANWVVVSAESIAAATADCGEIERMMKDRVFGMPAIEVRPEMLSLDMLLDYDHVTPIHVLPCCLKAVLTCSVPEAGTSPVDDLIASDFLETMTGPFWQEKNFTDVLCQTLSNPQKQAIRRTLRYCARFSTRDCNECATNLRRLKSCFD